MSELPPDEHESFDMRQRRPRTGLPSRHIPHNIDAEYGFVGWALGASRQARVEVARQLVPEDIYMHNVRKVWEWLLTAEGSSGANINTISIGTGVPEKDLTEMRRSAPLLNAIVEIRAILKCSYQRSLLMAGDEMMRLARSVPIVDPHMPDQITVERLIDETNQIVQAIRVPTIRGNRVPPNAVEFTAVGDTEPVWTVHKVVEELDRIIVTGFEGHGKSTFMRQFAVCAAAGLHPFTHYPMAPAKVLLVEMERSERLVRSWISRLMRLAEEDLARFNQSTLDYESHTPLDWDNLHVEMRTEGVDLASRADQIWLEEIIDATKPQLVVIGPLYKMYLGDMREEEAAREVARVIDDLRSHYRLAFMIEAHSPYASGDRKRPLRPYGSSLWSRWPEMGVGLRNVSEGVVDIEDWRPPADIRNWPQRLRRGGRWPWEQLA